MFEPYDTVQSAQVIMDRDTGRSKGFGFVEMGSDAEAQAAIVGLSNKPVDGRSLTVNEARPKEDRGAGWGGLGVVGVAEGGGRQAKGGKAGAIASAFCREIARPAGYAPSRAGTGRPS
jgi:RNA recognition motif-containing protein